MKILPKNEKSAFRAVDADVKRRIIRKEAGGVLWNALPRLPAVDVKRRL
jgi:hypothetical protein